MPTHELFIFASTALPTSPAASAADGPGLTQPLATLIGGFIVGLGALLGFWSASQNRKTIEDTAILTDEREREKASRDHKREVMSSRQDRYTTIAGQLASEHEPVRLAGIYALSALADEWQEENQIGQRDVAAELMCAYLRASPLSGGDQEVRAAAISVIDSHTSEKATAPWPIHIVRLVGADLQRMSLNHIRLSGVNLEGANLSGAKIDKVILSEANLEKTNFAYVRGEEVNFHGSCMDGANLERALVPWADFTDADVRHAFLSGSDLRGSRLSGAKFVNADLSLANLSTSQFLNKGGRPNFSGNRQLVSVEFGSASFMSAKCHGAILSGAKLCRTNLTLADFKDANMSKADMSGMELKLTKFCNARMDGVDLTNSQLQGVDMRGASLRNANLEAAILGFYSSPWVDDESTLVNRLAGADLSGAVLRNADLSGVDFGTYGKDEAIFVSREKGEESPLVAEWDSSTIWPKYFDIEGVITRQSEGLGEPPPPAAPGPRLA